MFCGLVAVLAAALDNLLIAAFFVLLGIFFDFFDGLAARLLNVGSELGKQLDSLADLVTSGVAPGIVMYQLLLKTLNHNSFATASMSQSDIMQWVGGKFAPIELLPFIGFLLPLAAAYRLANFNLDERQSTAFIGLPTPAMSIFIISLPLALIYSDVDIFTSLIQNTYFLIALTLLLSVAMNAEIPLFSLKFKNFSIKNNWIELLFLVVTIIGLAIFKFIAIPLIIISYMLLSLLKNTLK